METELLYCASVHLTYLIILLCSDQILPELGTIRNVLLHSYILKNHLEQVDSQNFNLDEFDLLGKKVLPDPLEWGSFF